MWRVSRSFLCHIRLYVNWVGLVLGLAQTKLDVTLEGFTANSSVRQAYACTLKTLCLTLVGVRHFVAHLHMCRCKIPWYSKCALSCLLLTSVSRFADVCRYVSMYEREDVSQCGQTTKTFLSGKSYTDSTCPYNNHLSVYNGRTDRWLLHGHVGLVFLA